MLRIAKLLQAEPEHQDAAEQCRSWTSPQSPGHHTKPCKKECLCFTLCAWTHIGTSQNGAGMASYTRTQLPLCACQAAWLRIVTGTYYFCSIMDCTIASACASAQCLPGFCNTQWIETGGEHRFCHHVKLLLYNCATFQDRGSNPPSTGHMVLLTP